MGESIEKAVSRSVRIAELESTLAARDAEIASLKALVEDLECDRFRLEWLIQDPSGYITVDGEPIFTKVDLDAAIDGATEKETE